MREIRSIQDVVDWGLCIGCGACYSACTKGAVSLINIESVGIRPRFDTSVCSSCVDCLSVCPGYTVDSQLTAAPGPAVSGDAWDCGPALEIWEGHATDAEVRFNASSGGVLSALALYCLEQEHMEFVLHTGMDESKPWLNKTVQSRNRRELLARAGSRYSPASPCDSLRQIEESNGPCVFIGKPCDASAVAMSRAQRPKLDEKLGLVLTFFCAGTPSTRGTLDLMNTLDASPGNVRALRYRGEGWPGEFKVLSHDGQSEKSMSYQESWGRLSDYRSLRCHLCPDGMGSNADIACGDAWEQYNGSNGLGRSIVIVRTARGREILRRAVAKNYVELDPVGPEAVHAAQPSLVTRRRELFGRMLGRRLLFVPSPEFKNFSLLSRWARLSVAEQMRTVVGTIRRIFLRRLWYPRPLW